MKTSLLFAVAVVAIGLAGQAGAGEALLSPRAKSNQTKVVPGKSSGYLDQKRNIEYGNAKMRQLAHDFRKVPTKGINIDLAHAPRPLMSPKDPRYEAALRQNAVRQSKVVALK